VLLLSTELGTDGGGVRHHRDPDGVPAEGRAMRKLLLLVVFGVAFVLLFKAYDKQHRVTTAHERVAIMLDALSRKDEQLALARWAALEVQGMDMNTVATYYDRFRNFEASTGISLGTDWHIVDEELEPDSSAVIITVAAEDRRVRLRVPPRAEIEALPQE
jgi:hypothetical protein